MFLESLVLNIYTNSFVVKPSYVILKMSSDSDEFDFEFISRAAKRTQGTNETQNDEITE